MATLNPLLDPVPLVPAARPQAALTFPDATPAPAGSPNLLLGVLRRWPWLALGLGVGLILGLLFHMQRSPVYQSAAQLLVIKTRAETTGAAGDTRVQYLEDYVATQVILLRSERILELAAQKLPEVGKFEEQPAGSSAARAAFIRARFEVTREKEPGSNTFSNTLLLTFKAPHPADAPLYLKAIIEAYQSELVSVYEEASVAQLKQLDAEIVKLKKGKTDMEVERRGLERKLRGGQDETGVQIGLSQEELGGIRARVTTNRNAENSLKLRLIVINKELDEIKLGGLSRATRLAVMSRLGIPVERPAIFGGDLKDPDAMLAHLKYKRTEMSNKYGPGHPDMVAINGQIKLLEDDQEKRGGPADDELDRYRRKQENEQSAVNKQLEVLKREIDGDEEKATKMAELQDRIDAIKVRQVSDDGLMRDKIRERDRIESTKATGGYKVEALTRPSEGVQVAPVLAQSLLLGVVFGLLLGGGLGLWAELADRGFRSPTDIRRQLGLPVLGHIPPIRTTDPPEISPVAALDPILAVALRPHSAAAEAVRGIRTQLLFSTHDQEHQVIQITSPNPGDGKSTLAANLAISLARSNKRVVLVDCDFRKPQIHRMFALPNPDLGLASVVADQADLGAAVHTCEIDNLSLLPCGPRPSNPAELLTSPNFQAILDDLRANYDFVILDTPPVLAVSDPAAVAPRADGIVLVFRMTKQARPAAERAQADLTAVGGRILGVVVNASTERDMGYGYGYGYKYDYQYSDKYADQK